MRLPSRCLVMLVLGPMLGPSKTRAGAGRAGVIDHEGALGARPQVVVLIDPSGQFGGQGAPIDVLTTQQIVEDTDLAGKELAEFGAEAVDRL